LFPVQGQSVPSLQEDLNRRIRRNTIQTENSQQGLQTETRGKMPLEQNSAVQKQHQQESSDTESITKWGLGS